MLLKDVLLQEAIECIDKIVDPTEKVKAIIGVLPFLTNESVDDQTIIEKQNIAQEVKESVEEKTKEMEAPKETLAPQPDTKEEANSQEIIVKENETEEEAQKRRELVVEKYGQEVFMEFVQDPNKMALLVPEFKNVGLFKQHLADFLTNNNITYTDSEAMFNYYMTQVDDSEEIKKNPYNMTVEQFVTKFYQFMGQLYGIFNYPKAEIEKVFKEMSNGIYNNIGNINYANAGALAMALYDSHKQQ